MKNAIKILLVEDDIQTCSAYQQVLANNTRLQLVHATASEQDAYEYVLHQEVDAIILDLELQEGDGLTFMFRLQEYYHKDGAKPMIVVVTNNASQITWALARDHGADYVIPKLHADYSPIAVLSKLEKAYAYYARGMTAASVKKIRQSSASMRRYVESYLDNIGVKGTKNEMEIIVDSVLAAMNWDGTDFAQLSKEVYPIVARKYHVSRYSIEKYIRMTLKRSWKTMDENLKNQLCPNSVNRKRKMTNTEFIANVAKYLKD